MRDLRLGKHGRKGTGMHGKPCYTTQGQGKRRRLNWDPESQTRPNHPLRDHYARLRAFCERERMHGWEVREGHVLTKFIEDLEHTVHVQLVLKDTGDDRYCPLQHEAAQQKIRMLDATDPSNERQQRQYLDRVLFPKLDLHARAPQRRHTGKHTSQQDILSLTTT